MYQWARPKPAVVLRPPTVIGCTRTVSPTASADGATTATAKKSWDAMATVSTAAELTRPKVQ